MGRLPRPTRVLKLEGAFDKNPQRLAARKHEPTPEGKPRKPRAFKKGSYECICWESLAWTIEQGVSTAADQAQLENCCRWYALYRQNLDEDIVPKAERAFKLYDSLASRFGATPADRAKLRVDKPVEVDETSKFLA